jgi:hypothetical protein
LLAEEDLIIVDLGHILYRTYLSEENRIFEERITTMRIEHGRETSKLEGRVHAWKEQFNTTDQRVGERIERIERQFRQEKERIERQFRQENERIEFQFNQKKVDMFTFYDAQTRDLENDIEASQRTHE